MLNYGRIDLARAKRHMLSEPSDGQPHPGCGPHISRSLAP
jgi:hypothetical protein